MAVCGSFPPCRTSHPTIRCALRSNSQSDVRETLGRGRLRGIHHSRLGKYLSRARKWPPGVQVRWKCSITRPQNPEHKRVLRHPRGCAGCTYRIVRSEDDAQLPWTRGRAPPSCLLKRRSGRLWFAMEMGRAGSDHGFCGGPGPNVTCWPSGDFLSQVFRFVALRTSQRVGELPLLPCVARL